MRTVGHLARRRTLLDLGVTPRDLAAGVRTGHLWRPRRGWYATGNADPDQLRAVAAGARIGCVSALRRWGVWSGPGDALHLHATPTASRLADGIRIAHPAAPQAAAPLPHPSIIDAYGHELGDIRSCDGNASVIHWGEQRFGGRLDWIVSIGDALAQAVRCQDRENAVACIDSALATGAIDEREWARILSSLPHHLKPLDALKDARAGSGNETIARLRIRHAGFAVEPQFHLPGIGTADMLVERCVVVEVDSEHHHSGAAQRRRDRMRTLLSQVYGVPVIRIGPENLQDDEWPIVLAALERQVSDARVLAAARRASRGIRSAGDIG